MKRIVAEEREKWRKNFEEIHHMGAEEFGGLWLASNAEAVHLARNYNVDVSQLNMKTCISRIVLAALRLSARTRSNVG